MTHTIIHGCAEIQNFSRSVQLDTHHKSMCPCLPDRIGIWQCWFLWRGEKRRTLRKTSRSKNQQQTLPTYDAGSVNPTQATLGGERSHHCATPAISDNSRGGIIIIIRNNNNNNNNDYNDMMMMMIMKTRLILTVFKYQSHSAENERKEYFESNFLLTPKKNILISQSKAVPVPVLWNPQSNRNL